MVWRAFAIVFRFEVNNVPIIFDFFPYSCLNADCPLVFPLMLVTGVSPLYFDY